MAFGFARRERDHGACAQEPVRVVAVFFAERRDVKVSAGSGIAEMGVAGGSGGAGAVARTVRVWSVGGCEKVGAGFGFGD